MNALTKNRILEKGDEYLDKDGTWKPVPEAHLGLQVMFSPCQDCRRPSEPFIPQQGSQTVRQESAKLPIEGSTPSPASTPISPDRDAAADNRESSRRETPAHSVEANPAKAESDKAPVPSHSGTGDHSASYLPTVVSRKAHEPDTHSGTGPIARATEKSKSIAAVSTSKEVRFPATPYCYPVWTGRNGTFDCKAINLHRTANDVIQIIPQGKRGPGNCIIEFPAIVIPEITEWLKAQFVRAKK